MSDEDLTVSKWALTSFRHRPVVTRLVGASPLTMVFSFKAWRARETCEFSQLWLDFIIYVATSSNKWCAWYFNNIWTGAVGMYLWINALQWQKCFEPCMHLVFHHWYLTSLPFLFPCFHAYLGTEHCGRQLTVVEMIYTSKMHSPTVKKCLNK